ncbi:MAG: DivIVA domain-containing protein [Eubacteriales bacterium]|nr:DivIVA domain-containing protein [Eubacteriales bacterium]
MRFQHALFGYRCARVNQYLQEVTARYEQTLAEQQQRITALREENTALKVQLEPLKAQQERISLALLGANARAEKMVQEEAKASQQRRMQLDREIGAKREAFQNALQQMEEGIRQAQLLTVGFAQDLSRLRQKMQNTDQKSQ